VIGFLKWKASTLADKEIVHWPSKDIVVEYANYQRDQLAIEEPCVQEKAIADSITSICSTISACVAEEVAKTHTWRTPGGGRNAFTFGRRMAWARIHAYFEGDQSPRTSPETSPNSKRRREDAVFEIGEQVAPANAQNIQETINEVRTMMFEVRKMMRTGHQKHVLMTKEEIPRASEWTVETLKTVANSQFFVPLLQVLETTPVLFSYRWKGLFKHPISGEAFVLSDLRMGLLCFDNRWACVMRDFRNRYPEIGSYSVPPEEYVEPVGRPNSPPATVSDDALSKIREEMAATIAAEMDVRMQNFKQEMLQATPVSV
tara:strand:+ start:205 stop:1152 length:948 start_codon:yes stop_codon:yes gene_type:complete